MRDGFFTLMVTAGVLIVLGIVLGRLTGQATTFLGSTSATEGITVPGHIDGQFRWTLPNIPGATVMY